MVKFRKNRGKQITGYSLTFKSNKSSSKRTVATANLMQEARNEDLKPRSKKTHRHTSKKEGKLEGLLEIHENASKRVPLEKATGLEFGPEPDLDLYTSDTGAAHWMDRAQEIFSVVVIPREKTRERVNEKNTATAVKALEKLQQVEKDCKRSVSKTGTSTTKGKYAIFGNKIFRGGHGFVQALLSKLDLRNSKVLENMASRMEDIVSEFVPSSWLRAISKANGCSAWPTLSKCKFVAAMASAMNYSAPAHVDDDFIFSIHQLNVEGRLNWDHAVVQYMCFPTLGFAIGLRPGDVILFNPHVHHCLSEKTQAYNDIDVHVTTFYVKTAHVGKNDNTLALTEQEEKYYNMEF